MSASMRRGSSLFRLYGIRDMSSKRVIAGTIFATDAPADAGGADTADHPQLQRDKIRVVKDGAGRGGRRPARR